MEFTVVYDANTIDEQLGAYSPFTLKRDTKGWTADGLRTLSVFLADTIKYGPRKPVYTVLYHSKKDSRIFFAKIRACDEGRQKGKSAGYRCIVLVDTIYRYAYLLHIYRHADGIDDLTKKQTNQLQKLTEEYCNSIS